MPRQSAWVQIATRSRLVATYYSVERMSRGSCTNRMKGRVSNV